MLWLSVLMFSIICNVCNCAPVQTDADTIQALEPLLSSLGRQQNFSETGAVFMAPTFSLDLVSLIRWATSQGHQPQQNTCPHSRTVGDLSNTSRFKEVRKNLNIVKLGGREYFVSRNQLASWFDAQQFCNMIGMDLVSLETAEESTLVKDYVETLGLTKHNVWISANKIGRATYAWVNGASMIYEDWYAGEPTAFADQHCLVLYLRAWFDDPCLSPHYFVCEQS